MNSEQQVDWLCDHNAIVVYSRTKVTLHRGPYPYVEAPTVEEAIELMMAQMGVVEGRLGEVGQPLLLGEPEGSMS